MSTKYYSEKELEDRLILEVKNLKGQTYKWVSPGTKGVTDRIVIIPVNNISFVETKSTGDTPSPIQLYIHRILRSLGCRVEVIDNLPDLLTYIASLKKSQ